MENKMTPEDSGVYFKIIDQSATLMNILKRSYLDHGRYAFFIQRHNFAFVVGYKDLREAVVAEVFSAAYLAKEFITAIRAFIHNLHSCRSISYIIIHEIR